jgi:glycosyltransferase involved in cell wall biosynthesis
MHVVHAAMPFGFSPSREDDVAMFRASRDLPKEFWLCVAGDYPHKNFPRLVEAFARLRAGHPGWPMVIRGTLTSDLARCIAEAGIANQVQFIPWLADEAMPLLYSAASALVFPSLFEGGGLPVVEAMACGCPVVASDLPTTREFATDVAVTFDPERIGDMVRAMSVVERSPALCEERRKLGLARAAQFRPEHTARACLAAYRAALSAGNPAS